MAVWDSLFLNPLGLLGIASIIPLIILYIIKPDPPKVKLPTVEFLSRNPQTGGIDPVIETLRRNLLLLIQIIALIIISTALASPYIMVTESTQAKDTVIVMDASASMATQSGGTTRFDEAVSRAKGDVTETTSVVVAGTSTGVAVEQGSPEEARTSLNTLTVSDTGGDLRSAISRGASLVSEQGRVIVYSDFADNSDWQSSVETARAKDINVVLRQVNDGGGDNVGVVSLSFSGSKVTASIKNFGETDAQRTVSLGGETKQVSLAPGDITSLGFEVPEGNSEMEITPHDSFRPDDFAYIAGHSKQKIDVLLVTNDENRFLSTALSVMDEVELDIKNPPVASSSGYDIMVFSNVNRDRLLQSTLDKARETVTDGGGVIIQSQPNLDRVELDYRDLLLINTDEIKEEVGELETSESDLVQGIDFPNPDRYIKGELKSGRSLINTSDGSPLLAVDQRGDGRIVYYGFIEEDSNFKFNYLYPVFWNRVVNYVVGREKLSSINVQTGNTLTFSQSREVETPTGARTGENIVMNKQGFYSVGQRRYSANLLSHTESDVESEEIENKGSEEGGSGEDESRQTPRELTPLVALLGLGLIIGELGFMKYRGDI